MYDDPAPGPRFDLAPDERGARATAARTAEPGASAALGPDAGGRAARRRGPHALGRIAARRGDAAEAKAQIAAARRALDGDTAIARQQERFFPYLVGYVALYTNDLPAAERELTSAVNAPGNQRDPFMRCLLAMTYERQGKQDEAKAAYRQAYDLATAHNPPAAFARRYAREKLGL